MLGHQASKAPDSAVLMQHLREFMSKTLCNIDIKFMSVGRMDVRKLSRARSQESDDRERLRVLYCSAGGWRTDRLPTIMSPSFAGNMLQLERLNTCCNTDCFSHNLILHRPARTGPESNRRHRLRVATYPAKEGDMNSCKCCIRTTASPESFGIMILMVSHDSGNNAIMGHLHLYRPT